ncbi:MAG: PD40 domain-containing protein [Planctomycetes bacterium]|nr:PD40 domain-containing protein [Planctomycetota bacterium]
MIRAAVVSFILTIIAAGGGDNIFTEHPVCTIPARGALEGTPVFSPSGKKAAYVLHEGKKLFPMIQDKAMESYEFVDAPEWAEDADVVAWRLGRRLDAKHENWKIYLDTKKIAESDWIGLVGLSRDGKQAAYWSNPGASIANDGSYTGGTWIFNYGSKKTDVYKEGFGLDYPVWSPDGKHVATWGYASRGSGFVMIDGKLRNEKSGPSGFSIDDIVFSPDGREVAYAILSPDASGKMNSLVYREYIRYGEGYDSCGSPQYTKDGKSLAYRALKNGKIHYVVEGADHKKKDLGAPFEAVADLTFSADGNRAAFSANRGGKIDPGVAVGRFAKYNIEGGNWFVIESGHEYGPYDAVADPGFAGNTNRLVWRAKSGAKWNLYIRDDGRDAAKAAEYDYIDRPRIDADGSRVAVGVREGLQLNWRVVQSKDFAK